MELQKNDFEEKNKKRNYRKRSIIFFILSAVMFSIYIHALNTIHLTPGELGIININIYGWVGSMTLFIGLITAGISVAYFFKYKLNK